MVFLDKTLTAKQINTCWSENYKLVNAIENHIEINMDVIIPSSGPDRIISIKFNTNATIATLKQKIQIKIGINSDQHCICWYSPENNFRQILKDDNSTVSDQVGYTFLKGAKLCLILDPENTIENKLTKWFASYTAAMVALQAATVANRAAHFSKEIL